MPAARVSGKWLFPKHLIDEWVERGGREGSMARALGMDRRLDDPLHAASRFGRAGKPGAAIGLPGLAERVDVTRCVQRRGEARLGLLGLHPTPSSQGPRWALGPRRLQSLRDLATQRTGMTLSTSTTSPSIPTVRTSSPSPNAFYERAARSGITQHWTLVYAEAVRELVALAEIMEQRLSLGLMHDVIVAMPERVQHLKR